MFPFGVGGRNHDDDAVGRVGGNADGVIDHTGITERLVLLERSETLTTATTDHDGPDVLSSGHIAAG
jgi:hypothetical protein